MKGQLKAEDSATDIFPLISIYKLFEKMAPQKLTFLKTLYSMRKSRPCQTFFRPSIPDAILTREFISQNIFLNSQNQRNFLDVFDLPQCELIEYHFSVEMVPYHCDRQQTDLCDFYYGTFGPC
ncbi:hypothetical protein FGO68_gene9435 [Halteria grandinella]|uniref:Uncharacterized protein n=1 Tax=Halteria grandinella TaxID=5974 RepID=A0A8J8SWM7_HALGN|nr:hypothetical protein FGO68_gene9435 [Halteria grandinella]